MVWVLQLNGNGNAILHSCGDIDDVVKIQKTALINYK